jgi:hypothetical protein
MTNLTKLIADLRDAAARCRDLKHTLRTRWTRAMAAEQQELVRLKRHATELCVLRAHLRGKRHLQRPPCWWPGTWNDAAHAEIAKRAGVAYEVLSEAG